MSAPARFVWTEADFWRGLHGEPVAVVLKGDWDPEKHPRDDHGRFISVGAAYLAEHPTRPHFLTKPVPPPKGVGEPHSASELAAAMRPFADPAPQAKQPGLPWALALARATPGVPPNLQVRAELQPGVAGGGIYYAHEGLRPADINLGTDIVGALSSYLAGERGQIEAWAVSTIVHEAQHAASPVNVREPWAYSSSMMNALYEEALAEIRTQTVMGQFFPKQDAATLEKWTIGPRREVETLRALDSLAPGTLDKLERATSASERRQIGRSAMMGTLNALGRRLGSPLMVASDAAPGLERILQSGGIHQVVGLSRRSDKAAVEEYEGVLRRAGLHD